MTTTATHSCPVISDGRVQCWGSNSFGELGDGTTTTRTNPVSVSGFLGYTAVHVDVGNYTSCAVKADGEIECWGSNWGGRLGNAGATGDSSTPVSVIGLENGATQVAVAADTACALLVDGPVSCWGLARPGAPGSGQATAGLTASLECRGLASAERRGPDRLPTRWFCALLSMAARLGRHAVERNAYSELPVALWPEERAIAVEKNGCERLLHPPRPASSTAGVRTPTPARRRLGRGAAPDPAPRDRVSNVGRRVHRGLGQSQICALEQTASSTAGAEVGALPTLQTFPRADSRRTARLAGRARRGN